MFDFLRWPWRERQEAQDAAPPRFAVTAAGHPPEEFPSVRMGPRALNWGSDPGEWDLSVRGTEQDFHDAHRGLIRAGFMVREPTEADRAAGDDYECYIPVGRPLDFQGQKAEIMADVEAGGGAVGLDPLPDDDEDEDAFSDWTAADLEQEEEEEDCPEGCPICQEGDNPFAPENRPVFDCASSPTTTADGQHVDVYIVKGSTEHLAAIHAAMEAVAVCEDLGAAAKALADTPFAQIRYSEDDPVAALRMPNRALIVLEGYYTPEDLEEMARNAGRRSLVVAAAHAEFHETDGGSVLIIRQAADKPGDPEGLDAALQEGLAAVRAAVTPFVHCGLGDVTLEDLGALREAHEGGRPRCLLLLPGNYHQSKVDRLRQAWKETFGTAGLFIMAAPLAAGPVRQPGKKRRKERKEFGVTHQQLLEAGHRPEDATFLNQRIIAAMRGGMAVEAATEAALADLAKKLDEPEDRPAGPIAADWPGYQRLMEGVGVLAAQLESFGLPSVRSAAIEARVLELLRIGSGIIAAAEQANVEDLGRYGESAAVWRFTERRAVGATVPRMVERGISLKTARRLLGLTEFLQTKGLSALDAYRKAVGTVQREGEVEGGYRARFAAPIAERGFAGPDAGWLLDTAVRLSDVRPELTADRAIDLAVAQLNGPDPDQARAASPGAGVAEANRDAAASPVTDLGLEEPVAPDRVEPKAAGDQPTAGPLSRADRHRLFLRFFSRCDKGTDLVDASRIATRAVDMVAGGFAELADLGPAVCPPAGWLEDLAFRQAGREIKAEDGKHAAETGAQKLERLVRSAKVGDRLWTVPNGAGIGDGTPGNGTLTFYAAGEGLFRLVSEVAAGPTLACVCRAGSGCTYAPLNEADRETYQIICARASVASNPTAPHFGEWLARYYAASDARPGLPYRKPAYTPTAEDAPRFQAFQDRVYARFAPGSAALETYGGGSLLSLWWDVRSCRKFPDVPAEEEALAFLAGVEGVGVPPEVGGMGFVPSLRTDDYTAWLVRVRAVQAREVAAWRAAQEPSAAAPAMPRKGGKANAC